MWSQGGSCYAQKPYRFQEAELLDVEDYTTIRFQRPIKLHMFKMHPSWKKANVVARMWGALIETQEFPLSANWKLFYKASDLKDSKGYFNLYSEFINLIRIELDTNFRKYVPDFTHFKYGVLIFSVPPLVFNPDFQEMMDKLTLNADPEKETELKINEKKIAGNLPDEILYKIFNCLDIASLSRCAQVNKRWNRIANEPDFYRDIDLKIYWNKINGNALEKLKVKLQNVRKLDMTWCRDCEVGHYERSSEHFRHSIESILRKSKDTLTHLCLNYSGFARGEVLKIIVSCPNLKELRIRQYLSCSWNLENISMKKLNTLDVSMSKIYVRDLIIILKNNPDLEHLVVDYCENLSECQSAGPIIATLITHNRKLKAWSSWETFFRQDNSLIYKEFGKLVQLEDLDLGFCESIPYRINCLEIITKRCKKLKRLVLANWRRLTDEQLLAILTEAKELIHLNLANLPEISSMILSVAINNLPNLRLLDIRQCVGIDKKMVTEYKEQYPNITIYY
ncbi:hypothetical protein ABEB36_004633 [Hypothenemus hampei]|uniref:F-box domain-containing protein n=1 Tax=Hypothenemus hampei TaxID=57062 RepID=A0ABD1F3Y3_HYPHA